MRFHLEPLGGLAGDMFAAAMLDLRPDLAAGTLQAIKEVDLGTAVTVRHLPYSDGILSGSRFDVALSGEPARHAHDHTHWSALRKRLEASTLDAAVKSRAIAIFALLAEAEAGVHDLPVDAVSFHEVGAWDSVADIVAAAYLIETSGATQWSVASLPLGRGRVQTAHGLLPVPAPATARLLEGFVCHDDGLEGERVTPTGAAILKHLSPETNPGNEMHRLAGTGYGFGTRRLEGMSNVLRITALASNTTQDSDAVSVLEFEIDDQSPEDLAIALDHLRTGDGVLDVLQMNAIGKQGRAIAVVRLLVKPEASKNAVEACFRETTTLGVRYHTVARRILEREMHRTDDGLTVKVARRPGGRTAKTDVGGVATRDSHVERTQQRQAAEARVLNNTTDDDFGPA